MTVGNLIEKLNDARDISCSLRMRYNDIQEDLQKSASSSDSAKVALADDLLNAADSIKELVRIIKNTEFD